MISICCLSLSESDAGGSRVIKLFSYIKFFIFVCGGGGERNKHKKKHLKRHLGNPNLFLVFSVKTEHRQLNAV